MPKILIVDDEESIAQMIGQIVRKSGYDPVVLTQAKDFMPAMLEHKPVLAVIDYMLPNINGQQLFGTMRSMGAAYHIPVIFITAIPVEQLKDKVKDKSDVRFMQKPLNIGALQSHISELLDKQNKPAGS